jgi:hypothetical protein
LVVLPFDGYVPLVTSFPVMRSMSHFNPNARWGGGWSMPRLGCFTPRKGLVLIVQEAGWATGPVWTGAENLVPAGIRSLDHPARNGAWWCLEMEWQNVTGLSKFEVHRALHIAHCCSCPPLIVLTYLLTYSVEQSPS